MKKNRSQIIYGVFVVMSLLSTEIYSAVIILDQSSTISAWNDKGSEESGSGNGCVSVSWGDSIALACQHTTIFGNTITATGCAYNIPKSYSVPYSQHATCFLELTLRVDSLTGFTIDLHVEGQGDWGGYCVPELNLLVTFSDILSYALWDNWPYPSSFPVWDNRINISFDLEPGVYMLNAKAYAAGHFCEHRESNSSHSSNASYVLQLTSNSAFIPEPASPLLLGLGGLALRRKVRK